MANSGYLSVDPALALIKGTGFATGTDSLKILSDVLDLMKGAGFATATDALHFLRSQIDLIEGAGFDTATDSLHRLQILSNSVGMQAAAIEGWALGFDTNTDSLKILSDVLDFMKGAGFATATDSLKALSVAIAAIGSPLAVLTNKERARLDLGFFDQSPIIETFRGYLNEDTRVAANDTITPTQVSEQCKRYSGASAWAFKVLTGTVKTEITDSNRCFTFDGCDATGDYAILAALHPIFVRPHDYATYLLNNAILTFECEILIDAGNNTNDKWNFFAGIANMGVAEAWDIAKLVGVLVPDCRRVGFTQTAAAERKVQGFNADGTHIDINTAFTVVYNQWCHLKFVWTFGVSVKYYLNNAEKPDATDIYNPQSDIDVAHQRSFLPMFVAYNKASATTPLMKVMGMRCYFQAGA